MRKGNTYEGLEEFEEKGDMEGSGGGWGRGMNK